MPKTTSNRPQAGGDCARLDSLAPALQAITTHQAFFPSIPKADELFFAVQAWASVHLLTFARALTQSIHRGFAEPARATCSQGE